MRYYISDLHFYHKNLIDHMDCRGFASVDAMNDHMISQWNSKVRSVDDVVILGDFCISPKPDEVHAILDQLNGTKYLIAGNHDNYLSAKAFDQTRFKWIADYKEIHDNKRKVVLSHYPIFCYNGQYRMNNESQSSTYMLYGHVHNTYDEVLVNRFIKETRQATRPVLGFEGEQHIPCQMINCFCMFSDYVPLSLDEWIEVDKKRRDHLL